MKHETPQFIWKINVRCWYGRYIHCKSEDCVMNYRGEGEGNEIPVSPQ